MEVATGRGEDPHLWGRRKVNSKEQPLAGYIDKRKNGLKEPATIIGRRFSFGCQTGNKSGYDRRAQHHGA
jgi:hypothetical protein